MSGMPVHFETLELGGLPVARVSRADTAKIMVELALNRRGDRPWISTSVNGQVIAEAARDAGMRESLLAADMVSCDGQPIVLASRLLTAAPLPDRVCTTDLFHDIAREARSRPITMYFLGATEEENRTAVERMTALYPHLKVVGRSHGFHSDEGWRALVARINEIGPDLLWVSLGVPREQDFYMRFGHDLPNVGIIKTSGGLFNYLSGTAPRAPGWMRAAGFEWFYRMWHEPRRLAWRYLTTNPRAFFLLLTRSRRQAETRLLSADAR